MKGPASPAGPGRLLTDDNFPLALLLVAVCAAAFVLPAQNDTWWHLHSGRTMWETQTFLTAERFSFASQGQPLGNHWWLTQLLFYGLHSLGGPLLLTMGAGALAAGAVVGSLSLARGVLEVRLALLLALLLNTAPEWSVRPQVVSLALLVLAAHLVDRGRVWLLPLVCLVWGNAHAMVVFGVVMAGAVVVEAMVWSRSRLGAALAVLAMCVAAPMVSPLGIGYWPRVLATVSTSRALGLQEYRSPLALEDLPFWILLAVLVASVVKARARLTQLDPGRRALLVAAAVLSVAALSAARNVAFFAVVAVPVVASLVPVGRQRAPKAATWPAYVLVTLAVSAAAVFVAGRWVDGGAALGWRPVEEATLEAVRACRGRLFNTLEDGGPLMWLLRDRPIFVDSRMEGYPESLLARSRDADLNGRYEDLFREFDIGCAVAPRGSTLEARLAMDPGLTLVHRGATRTVFVRQAITP